MGLTKKELPFNNHWRGYVRKCGCGHEMSFYDVGHIDVNCETNGRIDVGTGFLRVMNPCDNPMCEWSKLKSEVF